MRDWDSRLNEGFVSFFDLAGFHVHQSCADLNNSVAIGTEARGFDVEGDDFHVISLVVVVAVV